jgi:plastocyanin
MSRHASPKRSTASKGVLLAVLFLAPVPWTHGRRAAAQSSEVATTNTAARGRYTVVIKDMKYQPPTLTVKVGSTVEWKNADIVAHTVTAVDNKFDSRIIAPGSSWKLIVKKIGTFDYICTLHPNMRAKMSVQ